MDCSKKQKGNRTKHDGHKGNTHKPGFRCKY